MLMIKIENHNELQHLTYSLTRMYASGDGDEFILRGAILEVLQNTVQHSDGAFVLFLFEDRISVANLMKKNTTPKYQLGLKIYGGIETHCKGELFVADIYPSRTCLLPLDMENLFP